MSDHLPIKLSLGLECRVNEYSSLHFKYTSPSRQLKREWSESEQNALSAIFSKEQVCRRLEQLRLGSDSSDELEANFNTILLELSAPVLS